MEFAAGGGEVERGVGEVGVLWVGLGEGVGVGGGVGDEFAEFGDRGDFLGVGLGGEVAEGLALGGEKGLPDGEREFRAGGDGHGQVLEGWMRGERSGVWRCGILWI